MASPVRTTARLSGVTPLRADGRTGVTLSFHPRNSRLGLAQIDDWADLGPELSIPVISGVGKVLRVLRAARIAAPPNPLDLLGREDRAARLLARAVGTALRLALRRRSRLRFMAWTERGVETVSDVAEVREYADAFLILRSGGRFPVRFERCDVIRQRKEFESWYEVLDIERA
jgi:hypothetical protein